jgi:class 3 adenylate cyclase/pimeloyl-ACP methyl ester carboxylesterase
VTTDGVAFTRVGDEWVGYRVFGDISERALLYLPTAAGGNLDIQFEYPPVQRFFEQVTEFAGVVVFDRRGTGVSDSIPRRVAPTLEDWADDALAVLAAVGVPRVVLFAHAMGVPPALLFAASHPDRVGAIVTVNGFARMTSAPDYEVGVPESAADRFVASVAEAWGEGSAYFMVNPTVAADERTREWIARSERNTFGRSAAVRAWKAWLATDARHVVPTVRARTLVMQGTGAFSPVAAGRWLAANLPNAQLFEYENENFDWWYLEGSDAALGALAEFLTGTHADRSPERLLATVLLTDIVDSTALAAKVGDSRWRQLLDQHDRIAEEVVHRHQGRVVKQTGDGILATFDGPARGVQCARELRDTLAACGIGIRAGLHTGEIEVRGDDVSGIAVHIASRVASVAGPGEVLVSRTVPDLVFGSGLSFEPRGPHDLKGVPGAWDLYALGDPLPST